MEREPDETLEVLRGIWSANGQSVVDLEEAKKSCKNMVNVGFDGLAEAEGAEGAGSDLRAAWKSRLRREGKLSPEGGSVAELVIGPAEPGH
jgi:hypothetical protein